MDAIISGVPRFFSHCTFKANSSAYVTKEGSMHRVCQTMHFLMRSRLLRARPRILPASRLQHGGPHKEYFQNPGQMPQQEIGTSSDQYALVSDFPQQKSFLRRSWETAGLGLWSLLLGFGAGSCLITWVYLHGTFDAGTEEENEMLEDITDTINEHPAMELLLNDPGWEELPAAPRMMSGDSGKGLNFITGTLTGSKGIAQVLFIT